MTKFKLTKQIEKELKKISDGLPVLYDRTIIHKVFTGRELKLTGFTVNDKGEELKDDEMYPLPTPVMNPRNHYRRLKKAFQIGGEPSVVDYIVNTKKEVVELENQS